MPGPVAGPVTGPAGRPAVRGPALLVALWSAVFLVPHLYWAAGGRAGLGAESAAADRAFATPWFAAYNAATALLCVAAVALALALAAGHPGVRASRAAARLATAAALLLAVRGAVGVASLVAGAAAGDPWPPAVLVAVEAWFVLGALLWWALARPLRRTPSAPRPTRPHPGCNLGEVALSQVNLGKRGRATFGRRRSRGWSRGRG